jgi:hypothetical protein
LGGATWTNSVGNQTCHPAAVLRPRDKGEVVAAVRDAIAAGRNVRVAATGHSCTPVCLTDGVVLELADLAGVLDADPQRRRATALAGTSVGAFAEPLWEAGLALANQGDIDTQQIGGAIATGTHGSGIRLGSFSSTLRRARIVAGSGEVIDRALAKSCCGAEGKQERPSDVLTPMARRALLPLLIAVLLPAGSAHAATVSLEREVYHDPGAPGKVPPTTVVTNRLVLEAAPGEANRVTIGETSDGAFAVRPAASW